MVGAHAMVRRVRLPAALLVLLVCWGHAAAAPGRIYAEAWLSNPSPYVKEPLLYTIRIFSSVDLRTYQVVPPVVTDATLERVEESNRNATVTLGDTRYVTSDLRYVLTPLQAGGLNIGPARVTVAYGGGAGGTPPGEETFHTQPLKLEVREARAVEQAWRPLQWLELRTELQASSPRVGEPLLLEVETRARGALGEQLPSVATQLAVPGFKVYPERPRVDTRIRQPGHIWGRRVETFTLIPTREGRLEVPELVLHWWDLNRREAVTERVPARELEVRPALRRVAGEPAGAGPVTADAGPGMASFFLMVAVAVAGGLGLFWLLGDSGGGQLRIQRLRGHCSARCLSGLSYVEGRARCLHHGVVDLLDHSLPLPLLQAWWQRQARVASDVPALRRMVSSFAAIRLGLPERTTLHDTGEALAAGAAAEDGELIRHLTRQLDDDYYGGREVDLPQWREEWEMVLRGCLERSARRRRPAAVREEGRQELPALNPE
ncbi:MAG: hypothetical protein U5S82_07735 [Gammaproteobacteria bacterium]|nr:hypothetical protein [Gammaproteobacteria bacterium]